MSEARSAILAHGKNWELPVPAAPEDIQLSIESRITAEAAGVLFTGGVGDLIIFSTGHTAGIQYPTEAIKMREAMYDYFSEGEVPLSSTVLEEESYDTVGNLRRVNERLEDLGVDRLILLSIGYHLPRVKRLAKILDVPVSESYKSDEVIRRAHGGKRHLYARRVIGQAVDKRSIRPVVRTTASYFLEAAGWGLSVVDPKGEKIAARATKKIRHQK